MWARKPFPEEVAKIKLEADEAAKGKQASK